MEQTKLNVFDWMSFGRKLEKKSPAVIKRTNTNLISRSKFGLGQKFLIQITIFLNFYFYSSVTDG